MKTNQFFFAAFTAAFFNVANYAAAQVTIGGTNPPAAGAVLDLNSTIKGGLQLSNVSLTDPNTIPVGFPGINSPTDVTPEVKAKLTGAIVYNTNTSQLYVSLQNSIDMWEKGIYVWDGNLWNKIGKSTYSITFASYNLGADPAYNTPKKQIEYLATCSAIDAYKVYGDFYQWGRVADGHEKWTTPAYNNHTVISGADLDATTGQVANTATDKYGHFIRVSGPPYDWRSPQKQDLWGNGEGTVGQTDNQGGVLHTDGKYYQNTDWAIPANNPCVSMGAGWRVPTQDEWERLRNYDWNPGISASSFSISATGTSVSTPNAPLTWVPVANGKVSASWTSNTVNKLGGYAVYKTADWTAATTETSGYFYNVNWSSTPKRLYDADAPDPVLFLPTAGYRSSADGDSYHGGAYGCYWSSTINTSYPTQEHYLFFYNNDVSDSHNNRAMGYSIRCVK